MKQKKMDTHSLRFGPEDHYTYAGEIPWCDTFPTNCWEEVSCEIGTVSVPTEKPVFLHNGEPIPDEESHEFLRSIAGPIATRDEETIEETITRAGS